MYEFEYQKVTSVEAAVESLSSDDEGVLLAGGMTLLPTMKQRLAQPSQLIDLAGIKELEGIEIAAGEVVISAMTTHASVASSERVRSRYPALAELAGLIGDPQVRNRGTLGGSVANADPAADYPAVVVASGATVHTDQRTIAADDFFIDMFETALDGNEIITRIAFPVPTRAAYAKFPNPASRYAVVGVFVAQFDSGWRVAVTGASGSVFRLETLEQALNDLEADASARVSEDAELQQQLLEHIEFDTDGLNEDIHASAEYRAHLVGVMAKRALQGLLPA